MNDKIYMLILLMLIIGFVIFTIEKKFLNRAEKEAKKLLEDTELKRCDLYYSPKEEYLAQANGIEELKDNIVKLKIQLKELTNPDNGK